MSVKAPRATRGHTLCALHVVALRGPPAKWRYILLQESMASPVWQRALSTATQAGAIAAMPAAVVLPDCGCDELDC